MQVSARFGGRVELKGTTVKGRFLAPGFCTPLVNGKPARIHITREVILQAYDALKKRVASGLCEMRLSHPNVGDLPIRFGLVKEVRIDAEQGHVWIADSQAYPEMERLLTDEARQALQGMGLSMNAQCRLESRKEDGEILPDDYDVKSIEIEGVDIVDAGAVDGSEITAEIPAGLAARLAGGLQIYDAGKLVTLPPQAVAMIRAIIGASSPAGKPGGSGKPADTPKETTKMPKLEGPDAVPPDVRETLGNDADKLAAYMAAYNAAIEAGASPQDAHEKALASAQANTMAEDAEKDDKKEEKKETNASLRAKLSARDARVKELEAQVAAKEVTLTARIQAMEGDMKRLRDEKNEAEARADVQWAIVDARKATPAENKEGALLEVRKAIGSEKFRAMINAREGVKTPVGEMGHGSAPEAESSSKGAVAAVEKYGVDGVFAAGIHQVDAGVRMELAAKHPTDPRVRKHCAAELKAIAAKATKGA